MVENRRRSFKNCARELVFKELIIRLLSVRRLKEKKGETRKFCLNEFFASLLWSLGGSKEEDWRYADWFLYSCWSFDVLFLFSNNKMKRGKKWGDKKKETKTVQKWLIFCLWSTYLLYIFCSLSPSLPCKASLVLLISCKSRT